MARLGIDFGTSNTGAGILRDGRPTALPLEAGAQTLPTAVFVDFTDKRFVYGEAAARAMMEGQDGRFMRGLKSILGTPLAREKRRFLNERMTLIEVIGRFLAEIRCRSERITGQSFEAAISGRPVRFHSESEDKDAQAEIDLREAYALAGFRGIRMLKEPCSASFRVSSRLLCAPAARCHPPFDGADPSPFVPVSGPQRRQLRAPSMLNWIGRCKQN